MYTLCVHSPQPLAKYPWPIHNPSFIGTPWQQLPYLFSFHTNTCTQKIATLNNCEATNKRKWRCRAAGEPPNTVQEQQYSQASVHVCVCGGFVCVWWVWLMPQQNLPSWAAVLIFLENHWGCLLYWVSALRQQQFPKILSLGTVFYPQLFSLTFLTTVPPVHLTHEDGTSEGLWRLFAGTVFTSSPTSVSLYHIHVFDNATVLMPLSGYMPVCFADVYLCAVLICSLGLLSIFLFTLVLTCQYFYRRHRLKGKTIIFVFLQ